MDFKFVSKDINDTLTIAENIESEKFENMVICLDGELGCGKTVLPLPNSPSRQITIFGNFSLSIFSAIVNVSSISFETYLKSILSPILL